MIYIMQHPRSHIIQRGQEGKKSMVCFPPTPLSAIQVSSALSFCRLLLFINCPFPPSLSCFLLTSHKLEMAIWQQKPWTPVQAVTRCLGCRRMKTTSKERQQTGHDSTNSLVHENTCEGFSYLLKNVLRLMTYNMRIRIRSWWYNSSRKETVLITSV